MVQHIAGVDKIDTTVPVNELGVDSVSNAELHATLLRRLELGEGEELMLDELNTAQKMAIAEDSRTKMYWR